MYLFVVPAWAADNLTLASFHWPPYTDFRHPQGPAGLLIERLRQRFPDHKLRFLELPWKRALQLTQECQIDGLFPVTRTAEREKQYRFAEPPLLTLTYVLVTRRDFPLTVSQPQQLAHVRLANHRPPLLLLPRGVRFGEPADSVVAQLERKIVKTFSAEKAMAMLRKKRGDMLITDKAVAAYYQQQFTDIRVHPAIMARSPQYLAVCPRSKALH